MPPAFLGIDDKYGQYETARFAVLPVCYDATASYVSGSRLGPHAVLEASDQLEYFDEELLTETNRAGIATCRSVTPPSIEPGKAHDAIHSAARRVVRDGKFLFALGGEHGITSAVVRAVIGRYKRLSILQLDAHLDLRDCYEGSRFSHACVMRRCLELGARVVPVGVRAFSREEHQFARKNHITPVSAETCIRTCDWIDGVLARLGQDVYVSIDIDIFDPAYAPGTGTPVPGGLDWYQVTALLRRVAESRRIVAADIVEVLPLVGQVTTEFLAARVAYRLMGYVAVNTGGRG